MSAKIYQLPTQLAGQVGIYPNFKYMVSGDDLATVSAAGYLNQIDLQSNPVGVEDVLHMLYGFNLQTGASSYGVFTVAISTTGVITLTSWSNPGEVILPVTSGHLAVFSGTTGALADLGYLPSNAAKTNIAMLSAATTVGHVATFADVNGTIQDGGALGQAALKSVSDNTKASVASVAAATTANGLVMFTDIAGTVGDITKANGTEATNAVTASGKAGVITTSALTTAAGANYAITWTNTLITASSTILLTLMGGTNTVNAVQLKATAGSGTSTLTIYNIGPTAALNGTILIGYQVI